MPDPHKTTYTSRLVERAEAAIPMHLGHWSEDASDMDLLQAQQCLDDWVVAHAGVENGQRILDVGCGMGTSLARIERRFSNMTMVGVNNDDEQLCVARNHRERSNSNSFEWYLSEAGSLPFPADSFDRVLCVEAAFHFPSRRMAFREMARVLRSEGCIAFTDIIPTSSLSKMRTNPLFAFLLEGVIQRGIGPFQNFWEADFSYAAHSQELGLELETFIDISRETLPSYQYFLGCEVLSNQQDFRKLSDMTFAVNVLGALHQAGALAVVGGVLRKP